MVLLVKWDKWLTLISGDKKMGRLFVLSIDKLNISLSKALF